MFFPPARAPPGASGSGQTDRARYAADPRRVRWTRPAGSGSCRRGRRGGRERSGTVWPPATAPGWLRPLRPGTGAAARGGQCLRSAAVPTAGVLHKCMLVINYQGGENAFFRLLAFLRAAFILRIMLFCLLILLMDNMQVLGKNWFKRKVLEHFEAHLSCLTI